MSTKINEKEKFEIFKTFFNSKSDFDMFFELCCGLENVKEINEYGKLYLLAQTIKEFQNGKIKSKEYLDENFNSEQLYNEIINRCYILAQELNLKSSLEYANLFSYMLWNGYFSKDKKLEFNNYDRALIEGAFSYDIANGKGVCLNFSTMLSDFLNKTNYSSAVLANKIDKIKRNYEVKIDRAIYKDKNIFKKIDKKMLAKFLTLIPNNIPNHAFNLICDKDKMYVYDATNFLIFDVKDKSMANAVGLDGKAKISPYFSYLLNDSEKSILTLDKFHLINDHSKLNVPNFGDIINKDVKYFDDNKSLLNDFYDDIKGNVDLLADIASNGKSIKKQITKKIN